jgi:nucleotide-binding universal stress UspA family protein
VFNRILVPLDGSELAEEVLPLACYLAKQCQATLILFHVVEKNAPQEVHGQRHLREVNEAREYLDQVAHKYSSEEVMIYQDVHEIQEDGVAGTICVHTNELEADLIVLCAHGHGGLRDVLIGSIAEQVVRQVTVPVMFIRPESIMGADVISIQQILIPMDGSPAHEPVLPVGVFLANKCQAKLRLLTVIPTPDTLQGKEVLTGRFFPNAEALTLDISAQQAENYLYGLSRNLSAQGASVAVSVLRGDLVSGMVETIETKEIDMVIMATHGHSGFNARWEGSLTPRFLAKANVPVILVHVTDKKPE